MALISARLGVASMMLCALAISPAAHASDSCQATAPGTAATTSACQYSASENGRFVSAVSGHWEIVRKRGVETTVVASGDQPMYGAIPARAGDVITVRIISGNGALTAGDGTIAETD
jgi:hypothetical protein